jgi:hypothetical protein
MRRGGRRLSRTLLAVLGGALLLLALVQLLLPGIVAGRIESRLRRYGGVQSVQVRAWPAVELLWGSADVVVVHARSLTMSAAQVASFLWEAHGAERVDLDAARIRVGRVQVSNARLRKRGAALGVEALASDADVRGALPRGLQVVLLGSGGGRVRVRAAGGLFGVGAALEAVAEASAGRLIAHPLGSSLEGVKLTLFSEPHIHIEGVGANVAAARPRVYRLTVAASLR